MNRRDFLQASAALAALSPLPGLAAAENSSPRRMKAALTPGSLGVKVQSQAELNGLAQRHRFEAVEPRAEELAGLPPSRQDETRADVAARNLTWAAAGLTVDFRKDERTFRDGLARLPALAAALQRVGATRVGTWLAPSHATLTYRANFTQHAARLREIARILGDQGVRLGLEYVGTQLLLVGNRYPFVHTMAEARDLIAEIGARNVGLVLDSWHWWTAGDNATDILALTNDHVVSVDLNDAPRGVAKEQQRDNARELPLATGVIEVEPFLSSLHRIGYDGPVRAEPFNKALNDLENDDACAASSAALHRAFALIRA